MAQQQPVLVSIQPQVASVTQPQTVKPGGYKASAGRSTGGIQIACGVLSIIFGLTGIFYSWFHLGWPIWGGVLYVVAGSLGVPTRQGRRCLIIAYMVMSIISAVIAAGQLIWESIGAALHDCYGHYHYCYMVEVSPGIRVAFGMHIVSLLVALVEMIVAIVGSAYCCHGVCRTTKQTTPFVVQYNPQMQQQTGQIYLQQQVPLPGAPAQYQPQCAPMQYQPPGGAPAQYPQGAQAQYPPQGATEHYPEKGAPPVYNESVPPEKTDSELQK